MRSIALVLALLSIPCVCRVVDGQSATVPLVTDRYDPACEIKIQSIPDGLRIDWPMGQQRTGRIVLDWNAEHPLVQSISVREAQGSLHSVATGLDPVLFMRVGERQLTERKGWTIFFDRMQNKPHDQFRARLRRQRAVATSHGTRATVTLHDLTVGPFEGVLRWTFFVDSPFVLLEAVLATTQNGKAYLHDIGFTCRQGTSPRRLAWHDAQGELRRQPASSLTAARQLAVRGRAVCAEFERGALGVFPPPHRFFYPLDFSNNLQNVWIGPGYQEPSLPLGFGLRHEPKGDNRFVPWFNAPPNTEQELGMFFLVSPAGADVALEEIARLTRHDRFEPLPGHRVFSSHYHVEHTQTLLNAQDSDEPAAEQGTTASGSRYRIPPRLKNPGFTQVFRDMGIDIVHLAEFHFGRTPRMNQDERLRHLELLHAECARLSDDQFLLLPGEEPNVHLGGHWISFFPKPVNWVLNRPEGTPFVSEHPGLGKVYHVGGKADVLRLLRAERGLAWTAHPRIKGSTGFPDRYRDELFFQSDRFLGAAWKAMPADLAQPRLGSRVLNLLDDMANWGDPKFVLGEVDVFKIEPDHELYGHMNVNYLSIDQIPKFSDGWQPVLEVLRAGRFFVTTGEILIPHFRVQGMRAGETVEIPRRGKVTVRLQLKWTFPLDYLEIVMGDGNHVRRHRVDLATTKAHGQDQWDLEVDVADQTWLRLEVWDVATNGAFTQPIWLH